MDTTLVSNMQVLGSARKKSTNKSQSELNTQDFLQLLSVQLANQNPLEPMKDSEYYSQIAQLGTTQGIDRLNKQSDVEQAQTLMGKTVTAVRPGAAIDATLSPTVTGTVTRMVSRDGQYKIAIQEANGKIVEVGLGSIQTVEPTQNLADYANLVGKSVTALDSNGGTLSGEVTGLTRVSGNIQVQVKRPDGSTISVSPKDLIRIG
ncbi:MAG: flagellar hook capping FlgD N-terminal domain-containing protein [Fimbriimonas sp.]|jgi:flagellar basal-body rod modification protein FlgD|nr:flagellar hook capping FlgD N-terminal domain-containing protein [Fimbriimonas sp.]